MVIGDGSLERQQITYNKYVVKWQLLKISRGKNIKSNNKNQQQKKKIFGNDISSTNDLLRKMIVVEDESRARKKSASNKKKRSFLCPSMLINDLKNKMEEMLKKR